MVSKVSRVKTDEENQREPDPHGSALAVAAHTDYITDIADRRTRGERAVFLRRHLPILKQGGWTAICERLGGDTPYFTRFPFRSALPVSPLISALKGVEALYAEVAEANGALCIATSVQEIEEAQQRDQVAIILSLEGAMPLGEDLDLLHTFHRLGARVIGLTWNHRNLLGDGVGMRKAGGLTELGIAMVQEMNRLGVVVDISHLAEQGCWDTLEVSRQPVIASHSNCYALLPHPRNLKDDLIRAIAKGGGVIAIHALCWFVNGKRRATLDDLLAHIDHLRDVAGVEHIAIGPDLLERWPKRLLHELWAGTPMGNAQFIYPTGFRSLADLPNITEGLRKRDYSDQEVELILGQNLLRVFRQVWGG